jgi:type I restriction enzyme S subunit
MQRRMVAASKSSAQANLFQGPIRALPVMLPPIEYQVQFEQIVSRANAISEKFAVSAGEVKSLSESLYEKFFRLDHAI